MNKFVLGALALTAASTPSLAGEKDWAAAYDQDIESLAASLTQSASGVTVSGFLRSSYASSSDVQVLPSGNDLGGFGIDNARLHVKGNIGNYGVVIQLEGAHPDPSISGVGLLDAYATFPVTEQISGQMGSFRPPFLASSLREEDGLLFLMRTSEGEFWSFRDEGVQFSGAFDQLSFSVAAMNGDDGAGDDLVMAGRVTFTVMGNAPGAHEGALGQDDATSLTVGVGYYNDDGLDDATAIAVDAQFGMGELSAALEFFDYDVAYGDNSPWNFQAGYMVVPEEWEVAIRYEDWDDADDTTAITAGVNWYHNGHAAKWQLNYMSSDSDNTSNEIDAIAVGLTASI